MKRVVYGLGATALFALGAAPAAPAAAATGEGHSLKPGVKDTSTSVKKVRAAVNTSGCTGSTFKSMSSRDAGFTQRTYFWWAYSSYGYAACIGTLVTSLDNFAGTSGVSAARIRIWHSNTLEYSKKIANTTGKVTDGIHEYFPDPTEVCTAWFTQGIEWYPIMCTTVG